MNKLSLTQVCGLAFAQYNRVSIATLCHVSTNTVDRLCDAVGLRPGRTTLIPAFRNPLLYLDRAPAGMWVEFRAALAFLLEHPEASIADLVAQFPALPAAHLQFWFDQHQTLKPLRLEAAAIVTGAVEAMKAYYGIQEMFPHDFFPAKGATVTQVDRLRIIFSQKPQPNAL